MILSTSYFCLNINNIQNVSSKQLGVRKDYRSVQLLWTSIIGISYSWLWTLHQNCIISTNSILYLKSKSSSHHPPPLVKSYFNSFKPVRVWYIKRFEVTMTVCAEVVLAGLILNDFKTALYHPGWKWLIRNYLSVYSWHLYVTTSWAFSAVIILYQSCINLSHCFPLCCVEVVPESVPALGWQTSTWCTTAWCGLKSYLCKGSL